MQRILYSEEHGDLYEDKSTGVIVPLSYFDSDLRKAPSHYLLQTQMMIEGELLIDEIEVHVNQSNAEEIRNAIKAFDSMVKWMEGMEAAKVDMDKSNG